MHTPPASLADSRRSATRWHRHRVRAAPSRPDPTAGPSTATGWRSPASPARLSTPRLRPPPPPHPSNARSPHRVSRRRTATTRSGPAASRPTPAGCGRCPLPRRPRKASAVTKSQPGQRIPAPARPPPWRTPVRRPATGGPSRPTANPDPSTRIPAPAHQHADHSPPHPPGAAPPPAPASPRPPPRGPARPRWRPWHAGPGAGSWCAPRRQAIRPRPARTSSRPAPRPRRPRVAPSCPTPSRS
ncbi:hypothetical protein LAUMK7_02101 [Mycobacterium kansasii]|nr:hypothetical protein LAUMK40_02118 [Mycobacterium kansasii]VAZ73846.1 hypothetical protein LAUMK7_02101 [Mycobacterium kansasii]